MRRPRARVALLAATACVAVAAPAAHADSIAYVKDGNVWLSTSDGLRQFQVTTTGRYADVSQADDGTMIALTGVRLDKLDRMGNVLADFDTPVSDTRPAPTKTFYGPYVVKRGGTVVGRPATVGSDGRATARVKFTPLAMRALRSMKRVTLTVKAGAATTRITLRR